MLELFNLAEDPQQINNLYSRFPEKAKELKDELDRIREAGRVNKLH